MVFFKNVISAKSPSRCRVRLETFAAQFFSSRIFFKKNMKRIIATLTLLLALGGVLVAQQPTDRLREKVGVLHIDTKGFTLDAAQMGQITRLELDKLGLYEVLDKYDVEYIVEREKLNIDKCFGKICLVETGRQLGADKMLTGSVELLTDKVIVTMRLIDVGTQSVERSQVMEFLNLKPQLQLMIGVTLRKMFALPTDDDLVTKLTRADGYESAVNNPEVTRLNLSGPRMGMTVFTAEQAARLRAPASEGGADAIPLMFQFGYQFETTYLNQGGLQALFEFLPIVTGLDQGQFIPSVTVLHGLRSNRNGFEFAFGPSVSVAKVAEGFYDPANGNRWTRLSDWRATNPDPAARPESVVRFDTRGEPQLTTAFVFAVGKSFKSGKMNIPVNLFAIPNRTGTRFGLSVGFTGRG
jgi:hypothetical protein